MLERAAVADVVGSGARTEPAVSRLAIAVAGCVASIAVVVPTLLSEPTGTTRTAVPVFVIGAGVVFGLGLSDLLRAQDSRFARAVVAAGALWSLSALATSSEPTAYSIGRVSYWLVNVAIVYLLLSYPSGRLTESLDRALCAAVLLVVMLYLPTALIAKHFPTPSVWSLCASDCPSNAFALGHTTPALVTDLVVPLRELLTVAVFLAVPVAVWQHRQRAGPLLHRMYLPVAVIAGLQAATFGVFFVVRDAAPTSSALQVVMWLNVLTPPAVGVACLAGRCIDACSPRTRWSASRASSAAARPLLR